MLEDITLWFTSMETLQQVFWACAIVSTLFFVVQFVLLLVGIDSDSLDLDTNTLDLGGGFSLLTIKNLIHFFVGFGWAGASLWNLIENHYLLSFVALLAGVAMVVLFLLLFRAIMRLERHGNYDPNQAQGKVADVYLNIPAHKTGKGKVQLSINGSVLEFDAYTNGESLSTGAKVRVIEVVDHQTVIVEHI